MNEYLPFLFIEPFLAKNLNMTNKISFPKKREKATNKIYIYQSNILLDTFYQYDTFSKLEQMEKEQNRL